MIRCLPVLGLSRTLALLGAVLAAFPSDSLAENTETFFNKDCKERADAGDLPGLEQILDSIKEQKEIAEDYRYSYYRAVTLYERGEFSTGDLFGKEALDRMKSSQEAKGYSADDIKNVEERLTALRNRAKEKVSAADSLAKQVRAKLMTRTRISTSRSKTKVSSSGIK